MRADARYARCLALMRAMRADARCCFDGMTLAAPDEPRDRLARGAVLRVAADHGRGAASSIFCMARYVARLTKRPMPAPAIALMPSICQPGV